MDIISLVGWCYRTSNVLMNYSYFYNDVLLYFKMALIIITPLQRFTERLSKKIEITVEVNKLCIVSREFGCY